MDRYRQIDIEVEIQIVKENMILYMEITFSLSVYPLMGTEITYISWLLSIMLQWTQRYIYLFRLVFMFPLDKYPEMELLGHMVVLIFSF